MQEFDLLSQRIHPAESRVEMLAEKYPAAFVAFDLLAEGDEELMELPYDRAPRAAGEAGARTRRSCRPMTDDRRGRRPVADRQVRGRGGQAGRGSAYLPGERKGMVKIKRLRTADCVVAAFRYGKEEDTLGSLILGLYDDDGELHVVGHTSGFKAKEKRELLELLEPYRTGESGPGEPIRWKSDEELVWEGLRPELVVEVDLRPRDRQPHPPRDEVPALARGQGAGGVHDGAAALLAFGREGLGQTDPAT